MTTHFRLSEFASRGQLPPEDLRANIQALAENLEVLRAELGDKPIKIVSGWRSKEHNDSVGGAPQSQHLVGRAADIVVDGVRPGVVADAIHRLIREGRMKQGGVGLYPGFVHYDTRGVRARWTDN